MQRSLMLMLGGLLVAIAAASTLNAQSTLERLETQIRQRVATAGHETIGGARPPSGGRAASRAGETSYLGLVADDAKDRGRGVRVLEVQPGGPAMKSGFRRQDLITAIAEARVRQISDMSDVLGEFGPGQSVDFDILRNGKPQKLHVILGQRPIGTELSTADSPETVPLPPGEAFSNLPEPELAEPTWSPPKGSQPVISTNARLDQLERRLDGLERRVSELEKELKKRNKD